MNAPPCTSEMPATEPGCANDPNASDDFDHFPAKLGEIEVDVLYWIGGGEVVIQGFEVEGNYVDRDSLHQRVIDGWQRDIERRLGVES